MNWSLYMSGCPSSLDNDKRGGWWTEGSCWGLARGMESGHFQGLPRRRASARLQAVPLLCPELCSPSFSLASAPCPRTPCNDKARGERRVDKMSGGRRQAHDLTNHGWSSVGAFGGVPHVTPPPSGIEVRGHPSHRRVERKQPDSVGYLALGFVRKGRGWASP